MLAYREQMIAEVNQIVFLLKHMGVAFTENMSVRELVSAIYSYQKWDFEQEQLYELFCKGRYSRQEVSQEDAECFCILRRKLEKDYLSEKKLFQRLRYQMFYAIT